MQILFETALFCLAIIAPALLASSFKIDSAYRAGRAQGDRTDYQFAGKSAFRWLGKRKRAAAI